MEVDKITIAATVKFIGGEKNEEVNQLFTYRAAVPQPYRVRWLDRNAGGYFGSC